MTPEIGTTVTKNEPASRPVVADNIVPKKIRILGVPLDLGQSRRGVDMGPSAVRVAGLEARLELLGHNVADGGNIGVAIAETKSAGEENARYLKEITETCTKAADQVVERVRRGDPVMRRLPLCPLIHGGAMWVALQTLLNGGALVLDTDRHFEASTAVALLSGERVELTMLIGDATARPIADEIARDRARGAEAELDLSALQVIASGGAVLSNAVKKQLRTLLPDVKVLDTFGAS